MVAWENVCYSANVTAEPCNFSVTDFSFHKVSETKYSVSWDRDVTLCIYESNGANFQLAESPNS